MNKRIRVLFIISIIALFAWGLPAYWIAIPPALFIPVVCALCAACVYFEIRMQWLKNKLLTLSQVLLLSVFMMYAMAANIEKSGGSHTPHWVYVISVGLLVASLVLMIIGFVRQDDQRHEKTGDGKAESEGSTEGEGKAAR